MDRRPTAAFILILGAIMGAAPPGGPRPVTVADVAKQPPPGTVAPTEVAFTPDGKAVTYLLPEAPESLARVLWRVEVAPGAAPRVIARAPGGGDTDANVSPEEALRRERQRLRDTGITHVARAEEADVMVVPIKGDLYLVDPDGGPLRRLTETAAPEIDPKLNRDGTAVAYVREGDLYRMDLDSRAESRQTTGAVDGLTHGLAEFIAQEEMGRTSGHWWADGGSALAYERVDEREVPPYSIVHQADEHVSVEAHRYPFAGRANAKVSLRVLAEPDAGPLALTLANPWEDFYLARVDWDGDRCLLVQELNRDQKSLRLYRYNLDDEFQRRSLLVEEASETWINLHDDLRLIPNQDGGGLSSFLWASERSGFKHLELRERDGTLIRVLTSGDWPVDAVVAVDRVRREVWFTAAKDGPLESHLYRVALAGGPIVRVTDAPGLHRAVVERDGNHFVDIASSRSKPPVTTLRDRDGKELAVLADAGRDPRLKALRLDPPQLASLQSRDGVTLHGAYYPPTSKSLGAKAPLVVIVYGGPHVQLVSDSWGLTADLTAHLLAARGFAVWKADNRGSARRGHAFEAAIHRNMGSVEVRDQVDGVKFVAEHWPEEVDATRVGVTGASYGGYMTLRCLTEAPEVFKAGVAVAPVTDWDGYDTCYTERYMGTPADNPAGYKAASVLARADRLAGRLLVIHGMLDENVHFRHTARLAAALIAAGKPFDLLPLPAERHSSRREEGRRYEAERRASFFEGALGR